VAYSSVILGTPGLVSYWRLGEASVAMRLTRRDSNHGTINGTVTRNVPGLLTNDSNGAVQTDGAVGNYINVPSSASLNTAAVTVECWAKPSALTPDASLVDRFTNGGYFLELSSSGRWRWYIRPLSGSAGDTQTDTGSSAPAFRPTVGVRQHIVGTYSVADGLRLYVNGIQQGAVASPGSALGATISMELLAASSAGTSFPGVLDEVAIYSGVLTPAQILDHYNAGLGALINSDLSAGTIGLSGSRTESYAPTRSDRPTGALALSGSRTESSSERTPRSHTNTPMWHSRTVRQAYTVADDRHCCWLGRAST
jgi:hypothetical protein